MGDYLVLLPLAEEYIVNGLNQPAAKCLWAVINSSKAPTKVSVAARILLARLLTNEKDVENIVTRGIQDASLARLYHEKLELELILLSNGSNGNYSHNSNNKSSGSFECINEAKMLGDERLYYSLQLLKMKQLWSSKNSKQTRELMHCLKELQTDRLLAVQYLALILESWYHLQRGSSDLATGNNTADPPTTVILNQIDPEPLRNYCPPQYQAMMKLARVISSLGRGDVAGALANLDIDLTTINVDGMIYISTFSGSVVELAWLTRDQLGCIVELLHGVLGLYKGEKDEVMAHLTKALAYRDLTQISNIYMTIAFFNMNQWDKGLELVDHQMDSDSRTTIYLRGCFAHARGNHQQAIDQYNLLRSTPSSSSSSNGGATGPQDDLYILSTINLLLLANMHCETTGEPHSVTRLKMELAELCPSHPSQLVQFAWHLIQCIYDNGDIRLVAQRIKMLQSAQLRCIASAVTIPYSKADTNLTSDSRAATTSQLESAFSVSFHSGKSIASMLWVRVAALMRKQRYLALAQSTSGSTFQELVHKSQFYDSKLVDPPQISDMIRKQICK